MPCTSRRRPASNVTGETPANNITADEALSPKPFISPELATRACERRRLIRDMITDIDRRSSNQHSNSVDPANPLPDPARPLPGAVDKLSDPSFQCRLPFPFVGAPPPNRFKEDGTLEGNWPYMGRTK